MALAEKFSSLRFVVQLPAPDASFDEYLASSSELLGPAKDRITMQRKTTPGLQTVQDASVYLLRFTTLGSAPYSQLRTELKAHLPLLRIAPSTTLIVAPPLLPEPGSVDPSVESLARLRDLFNLQLTNECEMELSELIAVINSVNDESGRLVVANLLHFRTGATSAVCVKYEYNNDYFGNMP